jgi:hypothetical protein
MSSLPHAFTSSALSKPSRPRRENLQNIEEALWAAYRRYDRSAVMQKLLQHHLRLRRKRSKRSCWS